jgi:formylglycine-generating enzyme required for sulfatase activity
MIDPLAPRCDNFNMSGRRRRDRKIVRHAEKIGPRWRFRAVVLVVLLAIFSIPAVAENRDGIAVIIGNKTYSRGTPEVAFAHNDARAVKRFVIERLGYRAGNVIDLRDATLARLREVFGGETSHKGRLHNWVRAGKSSVVVFYSGHGVPGLNDRRGYLLPVDGDPNLAEISGYSLDLLYRNLSKLEAASVTVYLDACFSGNSHGGVLVRQASGLAVTPRLPGAAPRMTVLSAAESDQLASWDEDARHGLFTRHLLAALRGAADRKAHGDEDGRVTLGEVRRYLDDEMTYQARRRYGRDQRATVIGDAATVLATVAPETAPKTPAIPVGETVQEMDLELVALKNANVRAGPSTSRSRLAVIGRAGRVNVTGRSGDWYRVALADGRTGWIWSPLLGDKLPSDFAKRYRPGENFKDCDTCPEMVAVPPGTFLMGSPPDEKGRSDGEGPPRRVTIAGAMAVGKYEVTFAEWDACRADGGCNGHLPDDRGWGRGRRPVIGVSWADAAAYAKWLRRKTGKSYRLPSEAEWEYAARAGTSTPQFWGRHRDGACMFANVHDLAGKRLSSFPEGPYRCDDGHARTAPVGRFSVNRFGLHDMMGNVWEWVLDCWRPDRAGDAPTDDRCRRRVLRGGSWRSAPDTIRSAARHSGAIDSRDEAVGFRVIRALEDEFGGLRPGHDDRPGTVIVRDHRRPRFIAPPARNVVIVRGLPRPRFRPPRRHRPVRRHWRRLHP